MSTAYTLQKGLAGVSSSWAVLLSILLKLAEW